VCLCIEKRFMQAVTGPDLAGGGPGAQLTWDH